MSVESTTAGGPPGAVSRGARALARVVLPLAGWPISRWQRSGEPMGPSGCAWYQNPRRQVELADAPGETAVVEGGE
jgi:hypothetical protein